MVSSSSNSSSPVTSGSTSTGTLFLSGMFTGIAFPCVDLRGVASAERCDVAMRVIVPSSLVLFRFLVISRDSQVPRVAETSGHAFGEVVDNNNQKKKI